VTTSSGSNLNKVYDSPEAAVVGLGDGAAVMIGGFAGHHQPNALIRAVIASGARDLTVITHGAGEAGSGNGDVNALVTSGLVRKIVSPLPFDPRQGGPVRHMWGRGQLELEVQPVGVLTERIRAGGAGIGGSFLAAGAGTRFAAGLEVRTIDGREYVFQPAIKADFALLRASVADRLGNLVYSGTGRNWNPIMAMAARVSVAQVDDIREAGGIDPETVITPAIFIQRIVQTS
jgi:3-oxoadipate CoA-transferase alpha subunit